MTLGTRVSYIHLLGMLLVVLAGGLLANAARPGPAQPVENQYERSIESVVQVMDGRNIRGAGIVIDDRGYIVTNAHVSEGRPVLKIVTNDRTVHSAEQVWTGALRDSGYDLALYRLDCAPLCEGLRQANIRQRPMEIGERIYVIGHPFGQFNWTITFGRVSKPAAQAQGLSMGMTMTELRPPLHLSVASYPGNSGGGVFDKDGHLVGILQGGINRQPGLSFAVSSFTLCEAMLCGV